ncbi:unnamed protein product, partial [Prorocentrum cordatum]
APSWHQWLTRGKKEVDVLDIGKRSLTKLIQQDAWDSMGFRVGSKVWGAVGAPPLIKPLASLITEFRRGGAQGDLKARLLSGLVAGGYPTQRALYLDGRAIRPDCQRCKVAAGTPTRRLYRCMGTYLLRQSMDVDDAVTQAGWPCGLQAPAIQREKYQQNGVFQVRMCIDGSAIDPELPFARAGWAVVGMASDTCDITGSCYGPPPHPVQEAGGGEIYALRMAFQMCGAGPVAVVTDCKLVIDVRERGPQHNLERLAFSELWSRIFQNGEDIRRENRILIKSNSHPSLIKALERGHPIWAWKGKREAD